MANILQADLSCPEHQRAIVELLDTYARQPIIHGKGLTDNVLRELIPGLQAHPTTLIFLAFANEKAVGVAVCFLGFSTFAAKPVLNIHDLGILAEHRGQGLGHALLEAIESKAKQLGCCKITLEVAEKNQRARDIYRAAGYATARSVEEKGVDFSLTKLL